MKDIIDCKCSLYTHTARIQGTCHVDLNVLSAIGEDTQQNKGASGSGWFEADNDLALDSLYRVLSKEDNILLEFHCQQGVLTTAITLERIGMRSAIFEILLGEEESKEVSQ